MKVKHIFIEYLLIVDIFLEDSDNLTSYDVAVKSYKLIDFEGTQEGQFLPIYYKTMYGMNEGLDYELPSDLFTCFIFQCFGSNLQSPQLKGKALIIL